MSSKVFNDLIEIRQKSSAMSSARRASWKITVAGVDCTDAINEDLLSMSLTDNEEDEADDLQIKLHDKSGKWLQWWLNDTVQQGAKTKGLEFEIWIGVLEDDGKISQQKAGKFELDSVKHSGPPSVVTIKCTSLSYAGGIRDNERSKSWENYTLKGIAEEIAGKAGMSVSFYAGTNQTYSREEQSDETDIAFLKRLCQDSGIALKCTNGKLILFNKDAYTSKESVKTIIFGDGTYTKWDFSTGTGDVDFDSCEVSYTDPHTGITIEGMAYADDYDEEAEEHTTLMVRGVKVNSQGEATALAEQRLKLRNQFERTATFTLPGTPTLMAGQTIMLKKCGLWDGKYMIKQCKHEFGSSGYTTKVTLRCIPDASESTQTTTGTTEDSVSGGGGGGSGGGGNTQKKWQTIAVCRMYRDAEGTWSNGIVAKGQPFTILGSTKNERTYGSAGGITGWAPTNCIGKV